MEAAEGVLLVDKPAGPTSHDAVDEVRRLLGVRRVGHAGTLDPAASGLLLILVGKATGQARRFSGFDKTYVGTILLGSATDTGDAQGKVIECREVPPLVERGVAGALAGVSGSRLQVPPAYSAVKVRGRPAYWYARQGRAVALAPRPITIHSCALVAFRPEEGAIDFRVSCSAGTYIRTLAADVAAALGTVGHLARLRRERVGPFSVADAFPVPGAALEDLAWRLLPLASVVATLPPADISVEPPLVVDDTE